VTKKELVEKVVDYLVQEIYEGEASAADIEQHEVGDIEPVFGLAEITQAFTKLFAPFVIRVEDTLGREMVLAFQELDYDLVEENSFLGTDSEYSVSLAKPMTRSGTEEHLAYRLIEAETLTGLTAIEVIRSIAKAVLNACDWKLRVLIPKKQE